MRIANLVYCTSYMPVLVKILEKTDGKILELGTGISTYIIQTMCAKKKRPVLSLESHHAWFKKIKGYQTDFHRIERVLDWDKADIDGFWDVVLVDNAPDRIRPELVKRLANKANYIILHDSDVFKKLYEASGIYSMFKYGYEYTGCVPNTVVLSNFKDLEILK